MTIRRVFLSVRMSIGEMPTSVSAGYDFFVEAVASLQYDVKPD